MGKIVSAIGNPIVTDECTASKLRISYARILVEVDITKELPQEIIVRDKDGNKMKQVVEFEWKPQFCSKCQKIGHKCGETRREVKQWRQKKQPEAYQEQMMEKPIPAPKEVTKPYQPGPILQRLPTEEWNTPRKTGTGRGKGQTKTTTPEWLQCMNERGSSQNNTQDWLKCVNGFDALGVSKDTIALDDPGPC